MSTSKIIFELIQYSPVFEVGLVPQWNILCFRHVPANSKLDSDGLSNLQQKIRTQIVNDGNWYITGTRLDGSYWLRITVINPLTTEDHLAGLLDAIRQTKN
jgi:L-2,4-diaminobutyrate decarboxylase